MDCNKEEATRAKDIAEVKMGGKDFVGAKKLLLKALNLFPDMDNASHMLTVCEVHCSAESLFNGMTDHYGILQVELSADESLIRKQYRKLALLLHPDKNKFAGAEAAFKLVGEAYKVLSDQANRQVYDSKRKVQVRTMSSWQPSQRARTARKYTAANFNVPMNQFVGQKQQDQQSSAFFSSPSFWTMCVFCNTRFQYALSWLNREVQCQKCFKKFLAFEVSPQNVPPPGSSSGFGWCRTGFNETAVPAHHSYAYGNPTQASQTSKPETATNNGYGFRSKEESVGRTGDGMASKPDRPGSTQPEKVPVKMTGNARRMRNRKVVNSSESDIAESDSTDSDGILEVDPTVVPGGPTSSRYPRRSNRHRVNVTYKEEDVSDDDFAYPRKRLRKVGSSGWKNHENPSPKVATNGVKMKNSTTPISKDGVEEKHAGDDQNKEAVGKKDKQVGSREPQTGASFSYPDPELYDFDQDRDQSKFAVGQIWAVYDDVDGMPRYYALIQKVFSPLFKLQYVWLESNPTSTVEKVWVKTGLPIACGNFRLGTSSSSESQEMFSHVIFGEKSSGNKYNIYPKTGEVWALFKDWDIGWTSSTPKRHKNYAYEFVELVSDFAYGKGIAVSHLVKVDGFRYLFTRALDKEITMMPSGQLLKFSHRIPYYKVSEEREGIPGDSFELDPAALPESLVKIMDTGSGAANNNNSMHGQNVSDTASGALRSRVSECHASEAPCRPDESRRGEEIAPNRQHDENYSSSNEEESANAEFYDFSDLRSDELFKEGQIWALYCDVDTYPKFYAFITKVNWEGRNFIGVKWLELQPSSQQEKSWLAKGLPFGCGRFKASKESDRFGSTDPFSHIVRAMPMKKNDFYEIYPSPGEIWAVFKNWNPDWTSKDLAELADFDVVEIVLRDKRVIKAVTLTKVKGYNCVFMPETRSVANIEIPMDECFKFSHQIPAFRLTTQGSGNLKDYWELDPESVPNILLTTDP